MITSKIYFKSFFVIFTIFAATVTAVVGGGYDKAVNYYCVQGNSFFGLFYFNNSEFCPIFSNLVFILSIALGIMAFMLLLSITLDLIMWPIRVIIRKRKNRVEVVENFLYK